MNKLHHYNSLNTNHNNDSNLNINLNGYNNGSGKNIYFNPNETFRSNKNININKMLSNNFIKNPSNLVVDSFDLLINDNKDKIKANNGRINWGKAVKF